MSEKKSTITLSMARTRRGWSYFLLTQKPEVKDPKTEDGKAFRIWMAYLEIFIPETWSLTMIPPICIQELYDIIRSATKSTADWIMLWQKYLKWSSLENTFLSIQDWWQTDKVAFVQSVTDDDMTVLYESEISKFPFFQKWSLFTQQMPNAFDEQLHFLFDKNGGLEKLMQTDSKNKFLSYQPDNPQSVWQTEHGYKAWYRWYIYYTQFHYRDCLFWPFDGSPRDEKSDRLYFARDADIKSHMMTWRSAGNWTDLTAVQTSLQIMIPRIETNHSEVKMIYLYPFSATVGQACSFETTSIPVIESSDKKQGTGYVIVRQRKIRSKHTYELLTIGHKWILDTKVIDALGLLERKQKKSLPQCSKTLLV